jgi:hypothetical protein
MNPQVATLTFVLSLLAIPVAAAEFITKIGDYQASPTTSVRVYEQEGKIQYRVKSGGKSGGPTKPLIEKNQPWFIYPENDKRFWVSSAPGQLELIEMTADGISFSSSDVRRDLVGIAPPPVQERLKQAAKK